VSDEFMTEQITQERPASTRHQIEEHDMNTTAPQIGTGTNGVNGGNGLGQALQALATANDSVQELNGTLKMFSRTLKVVTDSQVEIYNVTDRIKDLVKSSGIQAGFLVLSSLHTTTALFINEFQAALMADVKHFLEGLANSEHGYLHDCEDCSDCERKNAVAHIRALVLGHNVTLPIQNGEIPLGQWQSILFAEFDGPRERSVTAQVIGV
jgi:secondary thiamine-phosphate synthase enzyme